LPSKLNSNTPPSDLSSIRAAFESTAARTQLRRKDSGEPLWKSLSFSSMRARST